MTGPYAIYIWGSFGIAAVVMILLALYSWRGRQRDIEELRKLEQLTASGPAQTPVSEE